MDIPSTATSLPKHLAGMVTVSIGRNTIRDSRTDFAAGGAERESTAPGRARLDRLATAPYVRVIGTPSK
jgi:hypothetical protein